MSKNVFRNFKSEGTAKKVLDLVASDIDFYENFNITFPDEYDKAHLGQVFAVIDSTDDKLITVFPKRHDSSTFTDVQKSVEDVFPNNPTFILFDITPSVGWDIEYGSTEYFKEYEDDTKESSNDKRLGFSGAIKRAMERNNAKKLDYKEYDKQPEDLGDRMADAIKRDIESYDSSEDKFQGVIGDMVNQPSHYTSGDIEVIEYIEQQAKVMYESGTVPPEVIPHICNAIKYISRFQSKGKAVEDLKKSIYYIQRTINIIEDEDNEG